MAATVGWWANREGRPCTFLELGRNELSRWSPLARSAQAVWLVGASLEQAVGTGAGLVGRAVLAGRPP